MTWEENCLRNAVNCHSTKPEYGILPNSVLAGSHANLNHLLRTIQIWRLRECPIYARREKSHGPSPSLQSMQQSLSNRVAGDSRGRTVGGLSNHTALFREKLPLTGHVLG